MKKNMKIRVTAEGIRAILNLFKEVHDINNYAERYQDSSCNGCYPSEEDEYWDDECWDRWCSDCKCTNREMPYDIMILSTKTNVIFAQTG